MLRSNKFQQNVTAESHKDKEVIIFELQLHQLLLIIIFIRKSRDLVIVTQKFCFMHII